MKKDSEILSSNISFYGNLIMANVVDEAWIRAGFGVMAILSLIRCIYLEINR